MIDNETYVLLENTEHWVLWKGELLNGLICGTVLENADNWDWIISISQDERDILGRHISLINLDGTETLKFDAKEKAEFNLEKMRKLLR